MASNQQRTIELRRLNLKYAYEPYGYEMMVFEAVVTPSRPDDVIEWSGCVSGVRANKTKGYIYNIPAGTVGNILVVQFDMSSSNREDVSLEELKVTCGDLEVTGAGFGLCASSRSRDFYIQEIRIFSSIGCVAVSGGG